MDRLSTPSLYLSPFFLFFAYSLPLVASHEESARPYIPHTYSARSSTIPPGTIVSGFPPSLFLLPFLPVFPIDYNPIIFTFGSLRRHFLLSFRLYPFSVFFSFLHFPFSSLKTTITVAISYLLSAYLFFLLCRSFPSSVFFILTRLNPELSSSAEMIDHGTHLLICGELKLGVINKDRHPRPLACYHRADF